jgi:hypothetical protein
MNCRGKIIPFPSDISRFSRDTVRRPEFFLKFFASYDLAGVLNRHDQDLEGLFLKPYPKAVLVQFAGPKIHENCPLYLLYLVACKSGTPRRHGI